MFILLLIGQSCRSKAILTPAKHLTSLVQNFPSQQALNQPQSNALLPESQPMQCVSTSISLPAATTLTTSLRINTNPLVCSLPAISNSSMNRCSIANPPVCSLPAISNSSMNRSCSITNPPTNSLRLTTNPLIPLHSLMPAISNLLTNNVPVEEASCMDLQSFELHCSQFLSKLAFDDQLSFLSKMYSAVCKSAGFVEIPIDFLKLAADGMKHLRDCDRTNVIYHFARVVGTMRNDKSDSLLPARRMPMGLIEYSINFFNAEHINQVC